MTADVQLYKRGEPIYLNILQYDLQVNSLDMLMEIDKVMGKGVMLREVLVYSDLHRHLWWNVDDSEKFEKQSELYSRWSYRREGGCCTNLRVDKLHYLNMSPRGLPPAILETVSQQAPASSLVRTSTMYADIPDNSPTSF